MPNESPDGQVSVLGLRLSLLGIYALFADCFCPSGAMFYPGIPVIWAVPCIITDIITHEDVHTFPTTCNGFLVYVTSQRGRG